MIYMTEPFHAADGLWSFGVSLGPSAKSKPLGLYWSLVAWIARGMILTIPKTNGGFVFIIHEEVDHERLWLEIHNNLSEQVAEITIVPEIIWFD